MEQCISQKHSAICLMLKELKTLPIKYIYGFHLIPRINNCYFPKCHQSIDLCNRDAIFFIGGRKQIFTIYASKD